MEIEISRVSESDIDDVYRQYRTTPVRQIARKLNKVELRFFVRVHKFDAGGRAKTNSLFARQGKFVCYDGKYASR